MRAFEQRSCSLRALGALAAIALVSSAARGVSADGGSEAAALFREGAAAFKRRDYRAAASAFEAADRASPHGAPLYNAGLAWEAAGEGPKAADGYALALARGGLDGPNLADAQTRLAALEKKLGRIDVQAAAGAEVSLEHVRAARAPVRVHVAAGTHDVRVAFPDGRSVGRSVGVAAGSVASIVVEPPPLRPLDPASPAPRPPSGSVQRTLGWIGVGASVVFSGVAVGVGVAALSARTTFDASGDRDRSAHDRAASLRIWTNVAWATAAATGIAGLTLVLTAPSPPRAAAYLRLEPGRLCAGGSF